MLDNQNGMALVITLAVVAVLIAAALQLSKFTGDSVMVTLVEKDRLQAEQTAIAGINLASLILVQDAMDTDIDSIQETWADPDILALAVNDMGLADKLTVTITDELSKIQVNAMVKAYPGNELNPDQVRLWENLLRIGVSKDKSEDETDPAGIVNSVKDWLDDLDDDAVTGLSGAESDYYLGLDPGYECANGPFNHVDELLSVKGFSLDLLMLENPDETEKTGLEESGLENPGTGKPGRENALETVFTVYGLDPEVKEGKYRYAGKININTANETVLAALLPEGMEDLAPDLVDFRGKTNEDGNEFSNLLDKGWYKKVIDLSENEQKKFDALITYSSDIFKVDCRAEENSAAVHLVAFLKREKDNQSGKWMCRVIQMERK